MKKLFKRLIVGCLLAPFLLLFSWWLVSVFIDIVFERNFCGFSSLGILLAEIRRWIIVGTLAIALTLSVVFKFQGKPTTKIWGITIMIVVITLVVILNFCAITGLCGLGFFGYGSCF